MWKRWWLSRGRLIGIKSTLSNLSIYFISLFGEEEGFGTLEE